MSYIYTKFTSHGGALVHRDGHKEEARGVFNLKTRDDLLKKSIARLSNTEQQSDESFW
jgi:hypothetical protein